MCVSVCSQSAPEKGIPFHQVTRVSLGSSAECFPFSKNANGDEVPPGFLLYAGCHGFHNAVFPVTAEGSRRKCTATLNFLPFSPHLFIPNIQLMKCHQHMENPLIILPESAWEPTATPPLRQQARTSSDFSVFKALSNVCLAIARELLIVSGSPVGTGNLE